jgi:hypothetical protein
MPDFLSEKRKEIESRLRELRPLVEEYQRLERAASALDGVSSPGKSTRRRGSNGRRRRGRRGRPRGTGTRAIQAQELVQANPGITIRELADQMGIKANYLYRVMPTLQGEGKVRKRGQGWHPA